MNPSRWLVVLACVVATPAFAQVRELPDFTRLVEEQGGAVVNIATTQQARRPANVPQVPGIEDEDFRRATSEESDRLATRAAAMRDQVIATLSARTE